MNRISTLLMFFMGMGLILGCGKTQTELPDARPVPNLKILQDLSESFSLLKAAASGVRLEKKQAQVDEKALKTQKMTRALQTADCEVSVDPDLTVSGEACPVKALFRSKTSQGDGATTSELKFLYEITDPALIDTLGAKKASYMGQLMVTRTGSDYRIQDKDPNFTGIIESLAHGSVMIQSYYKGGTTNREGYEIVSTLFTFPNPALNVLVRKVSMITTKGTSVGHFANGAPISAEEYQAVMSPLIP